jgi:endonuclease YncB( thermonuclease family)
MGEHANTNWQPSTPGKTRAVVLGALLLAASPAVAHGMEISPQAKPQTPSLVLSVGDGDTLTVLDGGHKRVVRLACIDAPELSQGAAGTRAKAALQTLAPPGASVTLKVQTTDRYGRTVAEVFRSGAPQPVNQALVRQGHAFVYWTYLQQCDGLAYGESERAARSHQLGVWGPGASDGPGDGSGLGEGLLRPWDYRACKRNKICS